MARELDWVTVSALPAVPMAPLPATIWPPLGSSPSAKAGTAGTRNRLASNTDRSARKPRRLSPQTPCMKSPYPDFAPRFSTQRIAGFSTPADSYATNFPISKDRRPHLPFAKLRPMLGGRDVGTVTRSSHGIRPNGSVFNAGATDKISAASDTVIRLRIRLTTKSQAISGAFSAAMIGAVPPA